MTPGQGQTVNIAGVPVGEISNVELKDGRAVITMKIRRKYAHVYKDATALLRPKTGLNDMVVELTPGTRRAGELDHGKDVIPITQTLPNVNTDEFLAALDGDTRSYLQLLVAGGGEALGGNGKNLSATFRRFEPTNRDILKITKALAVRRDNIRRSIHNFKELTTAVGEQGQAAGLAGRRVQRRLQVLRQPGRQAARDAAAAAGHAAGDQHGRRQGRRAGQDARPDARQAAPRRPRARPVAASSRARSSRRPRRSSRSSCGRSRATRCRRSRSCARPRTTWPR